MKKQVKKSEGLGDTIEKVLSATGVKKVVEFAMGKDCGCDKRKEKLNKIFPYKKTDCLNEEEYLWLKNWFAEERTEINITDQADLLRIKGRVFGAKLAPSNCSSCIAAHIEDLRLLFETYKDDK